MCLQHSNLFSVLSVQAVLCVAATLVFLCSVYSMCDGTVAFWESFAYCAVYFVLWVGFIVGTLMVRKDLIIGICAAPRPDDDAPVNDAPIKLLYLF